MAGYPHGVSRTIHAHILRLINENAGGTSNKGFMYHGADGSTTRPSTYDSVEWMGSITPTNAIDHDTWINTAQNIFAYKLDGTWHTIGGSAGGVPVYDRVEFLGSDLNWDNVAGSSKTVTIPAESHTGALAIIRVAMPSTDNPFGPPYDGPFPTIPDFTEFDSDGQGLNYPWEWLFYKEVEAGETDYTMTLSSGTAKNVVELIVLGGADLTDPIDSTIYADNTAIIPSQNSSKATNMLLGFYANYRSDGHVSSPYTATPGIEINREPTTDTLGAIAIASFYEELIATGATGTKTASTVGGRLICHGVIINSAA